MFKYLSLGDKIQIISGLNTGTYGKVIDKNSKNKTVRVVLLKKENGVFKEQAIPKNFNVD